MLYSARIHCRLNDPIINLWRRGCPVKESMKEIKAPDKFSKRIFLAGSIESGAAEEWQQQVVLELARHDILILNPRRDDWDIRWKQSIRNRQFREQVEWELDAQEAADIIFMYFAPDTYSPVSLLELGLFARSRKLIVCCPDGFWRKGNVEVICARFNIALFDTLKEAIRHLKRRLS